MTFLFQNYQRKPIELVNGEGCNVTDQLGKQYLDLTSGIGVSSLGHHHPVLTKALKDQVDKIWHTSNLYTNSLQESVANAYRKCYIDQPFVRIQPINQLPQLQQVIGSNYCDIGFGYNKATKILTVVAVIDNLIKGASGQAIQNFNIWAGLPQTTGLMQMPIFP